MRITRELMEFSQKQGSQKLGPREGSRAKEISASVQRPGDNIARRNSREDEKRRAKEDARVKGEYSRERENMLAHEGREVHSREERSVHAK